VYGLSVGLLGDYQIRARNILEQRDTDLVDMTAIEDACPSLTNPNWENRSR
jgi:hypothetical protein